MRIKIYFTRWLRRIVPKKTFGQRGEDAAARYLQRLGYRVLARGRRLASGELDLVVLDGQTIVFVEVKTRTSQEAGHPADAVDAVKQRKLTRLAVTFMKRHGLLEYRSRFDIVAITWPEGRGRPRIEHFMNAFEAIGQGEFYS